MKYFVYRLLLGRNISKLAQSGNIFTLYVLRSPLVCFQLMFRNINYTHKHIPSKGICVGTIRAHKDLDLSSLNSISALIAYVHGKIDDMILVIGENSWN